MSHYPAFVLGENVEAQLAPFREYDGIPDGHQSEVDVTRDILESGDPRAELRDRAFAVLHAGERPDFFGRHRFGWYGTDDSGNVVRAVAYTNRNGKWDWCEIGGRWLGFLLLKNGNRATSARLGDIDFGRMAERDAERFGAIWDAVHSVIDGMDFLTWSEILAEEPDIDKARLRYRSQPAVMAVEDAFDAVGFSPDDPLEIASEPRAAYIARKCASSWLPTAVVLDGKWIEKGSVGAFGSLHDAMPDAEWAAKVKGILAAIPPDTMITVVDCHI